MPKGWLTTLANNKNKTYHERKVYINDAFGNLEKITTKEIYNILIGGKSKTPVSQEHWEDVLNEEIDWSAVWKQKLVNIQEAKLRNFNFKFVHRILPTKCLVCKWKILTTSLCCLCNEIDDNEHSFVTCVNT